jgi:MFS transporter, DHA1 family, inner membrane transport protein
VLSLGPVRRALLALAVGGFAIGTGEFVILGLLPNVATDLGVTIPQAGHLVSAYAIGVVVGAPVLTVALVRMPRKTVLIGLMLAFAAGNVASALAPTFDWEIAARFASGLPHGAFFGVGAVAAAQMVDYSRRSAAMAVMFTGLTVANIVGVPVTTLLGQHTSWRLVFALIAVIGALGAVSVAIFVPGGFRHPADAEVPATGQMLRREFRAFARPGVWLVLGGVMLGGGGMFATFSYINPMMTHLAGFAPSSVTLLLVLFGLGMTAGNLVGARLADRALMPTLYGGFLAQILITVVFVFTAHSKIGAAITIFLYPAAALGTLPSLQTRMITLAGGAPNLAAAAIQAAFNVANSIGAWLGGLVIAAGLGYDAPNVVAIALTVVGLGFAVTSGLLDRHQRRAGVADVDRMAMGDDPAAGPPDERVLAGAGRPA